MAKDNFTLPNYADLGLKNNQESKICNVVIFHSKWLISFVNGCLFNNSIKTTFSKVDKSSIFAFKRRVK